MRLTHITYMKSLAASVKLGDDYPFQGESFLEIQPTPDQFEEKSPFVLVTSIGSKNIRDGKLYRRLPVRTGTEVPFTGKTIVRHLRRQYEQRFSYRINFWMNSAEFENDIISDPRLENHQGGMAIAPEGPGVLDQALRFLGMHRYFTDGMTPIVVNAGTSGIVTDDTGVSGLYKAFIELEFIDGIYTIDENPALAGAEFKLRNTEVETI